MTAVKQACPQCSSPMQRRLGADWCPACGYEEAEPASLDQPRPSHAVVPSPGDVAFLTAGSKPRPQLEEEFAPARPDLRLEKCVFLVFFILRAYYSIQVAMQYNSDSVSPLLGGHIEARLLFEIACLGWFALALFGCFAPFNRFTAMFCTIFSGMLCMNVLLETMIGNPFARMLEPLGTDHTRQTFMLLSAGLLQTAALIWVAAILYREGYWPKPTRR